MKSELNTKAELEKEIVEEVELVEDSEKNSADTTNSTDTKVNKEKKDVDWKLSFEIGCLIGAVFFFVIYGFKILDVTYDDWLVGYKDDLTMHYIGWRLFRNSNWSFPIGLIDNSHYPIKTSIIFTDSIGVVT